MITADGAPPTAGAPFPPCPDIAAVILAAGRSSRMGTSKPRLKVGGTTLLERVIAVARNAGVEDIIIVLGQEAEFPPPEPAGKNLRVVVNPHSDRGMFSSVQTGVRNLPPGCRAFFVMPVDIPFIRPSTLVQLHTASLAPGTLVCRPRYQGRRGHPPLLAAVLVPELLAYDGAGGLRALLARFEKETRNVDVDDPGTLIDLDTPADIAAYGPPSPPGRQTTAG